MGILSGKDFFFRLPPKYRNHEPIAVTVGAFLGYMTERTGGIVPAMICHAVNNIIATVLTARNVDFSGTWPNGLALRAGVIVIATSLLYLRSHLRAVAESATGTQKIQQRCLP
jgi:chromate transport protein ChrA